VYVALRLCAIGLPVDRPLLPAAESRPLFVLQDSLPRIKSFVARKLFPHAVPPAITPGLPSATSLLHPSPVVV
jgi:hypothetical protein